MTSGDTLRRLVRRFGVMVVLTLLGAAAGGIYGATKEPVYTAKAYVVAIGEPGDSISALNFAQAFGRVATSGPVKALAAPQLDTDRSGIDDVTASTSPDAPIIEFTATGHSPGHTAAVANAMANALVDLANTRKSDTKVNLALLAGATVPGTPTSPQPPLELAVGTAAGLLISGLAFLAGVGRSSAARPTDGPAADGYTTATATRFIEPIEAARSPLWIEPDLDGWRAVGRPAITAYRSGSGSGDLRENVAFGPPGVPTQRIVGRAPVSGSDDERLEPLIETASQPAGEPEVEAAEPPVEPVRIVGRASVAGAEGEDR